MGRSKKPTAAELKKIRLVKMIREVTGSGYSPDTWNPAELSDGLKQINYIRNLVDTWNPAQLNEAIKLLGFKTIDSWNPAIIDEMKSALIRIFSLHFVTGNPITLNLTGELPYLIKEATATFSPKQSGTGDPSPQNIRPISGWDSLSLTRTVGKNLFDKTAITDASWLSTTTGEVETSSSTTNYIVSDFIPVLANQSVYIPASGSARRWFYDSNRNPVTYLNNSGNQIYTPMNSGFIRITINKTQISLDTYQVEWGSSASEYVAYNGQTYPATFSDTIYGGNYDFVSGDGSETWGYIASYNGETLPGVWISDRDVYAEGTTPTTGAEVAYELSTPTPISLTGQEIEPLPGINVFSTDADTLNIKYQIDLS